MVESHRKNTRSMLGDFRLAFEASELKLEEFVKSGEWSYIAETYNKEVEHFITIYDYKDLILIDLEGNILYTYEQESDLGTNIFLGKFSNTLFGKSIKQAFDEERPIFSDFEYYAPTKGEPACFMISLIYDENGEKAGLIAAQVSNAMIDKIMQSNIEIENQWDSYLIGADLKMRSNSALDKAPAILKAEVKTEQTLLWQKNHVERSATLYLKKDNSSIYMGRNGIKVIGIYKPIEIEGVPLCVITELPQSIAFNAIDKQKETTFIWLIITVLIVVILAFWIARRTTKPILQISNWALQVSTGDLTYEKKSKRKDEIGVLSDSIMTMIDSFRAITSQADKIAEGDFTSEISLRSEKDELGIALQKMMKTLRDMTDMVQKVAAGDLSIRIKEKSDKDQLSSAVNKMVATLKDIHQENETQNWLKTGQNELNEKMRGEQDVVQICDNIIVFLAEYLGAQIGAIYLTDLATDELRITGCYAFIKRKGLNETIKLREGLVGQAAYLKKMISISDIPQDYIRIGSAIGDAPPKNVVAVPFILEEKTIGVVELGAFKEFSDVELLFLENITESIAIGITAAQSHHTTKALLEQTQAQAEELQAQQEELKAANEELEEQTERLRASEEELKAQQEELQATNEELAEKTRYLETKQEEIVQKNNGLEIAKKEIERKAKEVEIASKYKSDFLANMSHELRTPLNSLLLLAQDLTNNKKGNLFEDQVESAEIIYKSGSDLLNLINDILDLSKIEAGKMTLNIDWFSFEDLTSAIHSNFRHVLDDKGLALKIQMDDQLPSKIRTDPQKLMQIIKNLMSNAIKFTEIGEITVQVFKPSMDADFSKSGLLPLESIGISVTDTGIGIPKEKKLEIFEAFQQIDGSSTRQYSGTGLGLSISRELAKLLNGEIKLESMPGKGSTFTLFLPELLNKDPNKNLDKAVVIENPSRPETLSKSFLMHDKKELESAPGIADDKNNINTKDRLLLVIEDDPNFAKILYRFCHEKQFKCIHAPNGETGLAHAKKYHPDGIILDIKMPGMNGWEVLDELKRNPETRHVPVHMMSVEQESFDAFKKGAIGYLTKPASNEQIIEAFLKVESVIAKVIKDLLIVEDDKNLQKGLIKLIESQDIKITAVMTGKEAMEKLESKPFDCMILDLNLPDISGFDLLNTLNQTKNIHIPPTIIYTGKDLTQEENEILQGYTQSIIVKGVKSEERLLDEITLFLHQEIKSLPDDKKKMISKLYDMDTVFKDKKILLVDDDMRNVYAISKILDEKGVVVFKAPNGKKALEMLDEEPKMDLVLMDIMMPIMDGYSTMRKIREQKRFKKLPIIAQTAKAMQEDRHKCIEAGANDYISKPLDMNKLLSLMNVWIYR